MTDIKKIAFLLLISLIMFACTQANGEKLVETPLIEASKVVLPSSTPEVCTETRGHFDFFKIESSLMNYPLEGRLYLPPCYDTDVNKFYPVLYFLHGQSFNDDQWDRLGADEKLDELILLDKIEPFIIVMPRETNYINNQWDSKYGLSLAEELIPWIDANYRTVPERAGRAIGGLSRGAAWAMRIGLTHWETFGAIGCHSFAPFRGDFNEAPFWFKEIPEDKFLRIYIDMGVLDVNLDPANVFELRLTNYHIPHEWHIFLGTHNEDYWSDHVMDYLKWYAAGWE